MAQKRRALKKAEIRKRKIKRFFGTLIVVVVLCGVLVGLSCTVFFNAETIKASGSKHYTAEQIVDAADVSVGDNLVLMDGEAIAQKVQERLPLIGEVTVDKNLPSEVSIRVKDAVVDMAFIVNEQYLYTDQYRAVRFSDIQPKNQILILADIGTPTLGKSVDLSDEQKGLIQGLVEVFEQSGITKINQIDLRVSSEITLICENNFLIQFGSYENQQYKADNVADIMESVKEKYGQKVQGIINVQSLSDTNNTSYFKIEAVSMEPAKKEPVVSDAPDVTSSESPQSSEL